MNTNAKRRYIAPGLIVLGLLTSVVGCGPIVSGVQIVNANIAISAAETAGAKKHALYEYTAAKEYLHKAREENSYSDFWAARVYADKALEQAVKARKLAQTMSAATEPVMLPQEPAGAGAPSK